ncbi:MAG: hypothetical protein ACXW3N_03955 [Rhodoplanes sp.]
MARSYAVGGLIALVALGAVEARAQTDLNAGMTPAQLFAANCAACHRSPQGLARGRDPYTIANILRDHYTSRPAIATAIAGYLVSVRGPARPAAGPATPGGEQTGAAASAARTRPLERLTNPTVERLKSFAADADAAKPSTPDAPARGVERLLSYSASGVAANSLREAAVAAAPHAARPGVPEPGIRPARTITTRPDDAAAKTDSSISAGAVAAPAPAVPSPVFPLRGPPPSSAMPTMQSNEDMR